MHEFEHLVAATEIALWAGLAANMIAAGLLATSWKGARAVLLLLVIGCTQGGLALLWR